jgi:hypothetical protein
MKGLKVAKEDHQDGVDVLKATDVCGIAYFQLEFIAFGEVCVIGSFNAKGWRGEDLLFRRKLLIAAVLGA